MRFEDVYVPLGLAWSTPFARWQGPLAEVNSLDMGVVTDRMSNRPLMLYSSQATPGGAPIPEHWVLGPMKRDPTTDQRGSGPDPRA